MDGEDTAIGEVEHQLARLRDANAGTFMRTSVMTHLAWVPEEWLGKARDTLHRLEERHPSRTNLITPREGDETRIDADISLTCFKLPGTERHVCTEVIELALAGTASRARRASCCRS